MHAATPQLPRRLAKLGLVCLLAGGGLAKGAVQFDVFMGFAGKARQGEWFPVTFEIFNDGPTFDGQVELRPRFGDNLVYRYDVELATNTRKRFTLAVFADTNAGWSAKLKNGGKTVAKHDELRLDNSDPDTVLIGALSGQQAGGPVLPKTRFKRKWDNDRFAPRVAHLQLDTFPDDPIALSGLNALYLNSARAINLRTEQAAALSTWVLGGGHLILAVDQPGDVTSTPWLAGLVRGKFGPVQNSAVGQTLRHWAEAGGYSNVGGPDDDFAAAKLAVAEVRLAKDDAERAALWKCRKRAFGAIGRLSPNYVTQDGVVPRSKLPEIMRFIRTVSDKYELRIPNVFHAGDGNIHPLILYDERKPGQVKRALQAGHDILGKCIELGGSVTGEHGIGAEKIDFMSRQFAKDDLDAMQQLRRVFDPEKRCNSHKMFPGAKRCAEFTQKKQIPA